MPSPSRRSNPHHAVTAPATGRLARRTALAGAVVAAAGGATALYRSLTTTPPHPARQAAPTPPSQATTSPPTSPSPTSQTTDLLDGWSLEEKIGQLLMVAVPAGSSAPVWTPALTAHHIGGVFLGGRVTSGTAPVRALVDALGAAGSSAHGTALLVATDQEGGNVQVLRGPGMSDIPDARTQGTWPTQRLTDSARTWGAELAAAGVTMDLAPVADLVDLPDPDANSPIGHWKREYSHDAPALTTAVAAVCEGLRSSGVAPTIKHFPGLGRVKDNTDTTAGVTDTVTTADDAAVGVFASLISASVEAVMVSSAVYTHIDPDHPAMFSPAVVTELLRGRLGFRGVVITDDVGNAAQVRALSPADRAVQAVAAGCDIVLGAADASTVEQMAQALTQRAQQDPTFATTVDAAARRVLALKQTVAGWRGEGGVEPSA